MDVRRYLALEPDVPPVDEPLVLPLSPPQSFAAHCASLGLSVAHLDDLLFWPERVAAGVLVAFSCDAPLALMWFCALSRPVDLLVEDFEVFDVVEFDGFDVEPDVPTSPLLLFTVDDVAEPEVPAMLPLVVSIELPAALSVDGVELLLPSDPEVEPLLPIDAPEPLSDELPDVEDVPLPYVLGVVLEPFVLAEPALLLCVVVALVLLVSFLCLRSPIARAEPLASAMMEVSTNAGASLRILPPIGLWFRGITCGRLVARRMPST